jgi:hypothetical protein
MIIVAPKVERTLRPGSLLRKYPSAVYVAARLQRVGWGSDKGKELLHNFREALIRECGREFPEVLRQLRFISF